MLGDGISMEIKICLNKKRTANIPFAHWLIDRFVIPQRIIDFGCGSGVILNTILKLIPDDVDTELYAMDGMEEAKEFLDKRIRFAQCDFSECGEIYILPEMVQHQFDWVISTEVAEHLPKECAKDFIRLLTNSVYPLGKIFFSAAQPGDGGEGHYNEQPKKYWRDMFIEMDFEECPHDFETYFQKVCPNQKIDKLTGKRLPGYARNLMIFRRALHD
jgi:2-polyprenyl-3-methyl-5-hydroxy-6-metoxy-1,4-benzoquinol methylase